MQSRIILDRVTKSYKKCVAVNDVSLSIDRPMIYGLIGRNGAGKTTLLKLIAGLARPTSGSVGCVTEKGIGVLIESPGLYTHLSARANVIVKLKIMGDEDESHADALLDCVGLSSVGKKRVGNFSLGMKQRLGVALALAGDPDVLLLDEPINGLDPEGIVFMRDLMRRLEREGKIIIISSHLLGELSKIADSYGFIDNGKLVREIDAPELSSVSTQSHLLLVDRAAEAASILLREGFGFTVTADQIELKEDEEKASLALLALIQGGVKIREFRSYDTPLENLFLSEGGDRK